MRKVVSIVIGLLAAYVYAVPFAPISYVDNKCSQVLTSANAYTDLKNFGNVNTNDVMAIIESEVGGTNSLIHTLEPSTNYTNTATNDLAATLRGEIAAINVDRIVGENTTIFANGMWLCHTNDTDGVVTTNWVANTSNTVSSIKVCETTYKVQGGSIDLGKLVRSEIADSTSVFATNLLAVAERTTENKISATYPAFSNAVLAVGLNIDTNSVAIINEIAESFGGFPVGGTATTVGGLLAALAVAIVWLKNHKQNRLTSGTGIAIENDSISTDAVRSFAGVGTQTPSVSGGVADLSTLFSGTNTSNNLDNIRVSAVDSTTAATIIGQKAAASDLPYGHNTLTMTDGCGTATDGSINIPDTTSAAMTFNLPIPTSGKIADLIIQIDASTYAVQPTFLPVGGVATDISWRNVSGDTITQGSGKIYWLMVQMWDNPSGSAKAYTGVLTIRELTA